MRRRKQAINTGMRLPNVRSRNILHLFFVCLQPVNVNVPWIRLFHSWKSKTILMDLLSSSKRAQTTLKEKFLKFCIGAMYGVQHESRTFFDKNFLLLTRFPSQNRVQQNRSNCWIKILLCNIWRRDYATSTALRIFVAKNINMYVLLGVSVCIQGWEWYAGKRSQTANSRKCSGFRSAGKVWENKLGNQCLETCFYRTDQSEGAVRHADATLYWQDVGKPVHFTAANREIPVGFSAYPKRSMLY